MKDTMLERLLPCTAGLTGDLLIGFSAGADSAALTLLMLEARRRAPDTVRLTAVHVNHGLRGEASDGDEAFVRAFCAAHGLPLITERLIPPPDPSEDWARRERYAVYRRAAEAIGSRTVLLAHHRRDQAETLLLHLLRGSGLDGLTGMSRVTERDGLVIIRPLLEVSPEDLRALLAECGQDWREDASNDSPRWLRNRVRHELLPLMEDLMPGAEKRLTAMTPILTQDADALNMQAECLAKRITVLPEEPSMLRTDVLAAQPDAVRNRVLRLWLARMNAGADEAPGREATEAFASLLRAPAGTHLQLPGGLTAWRGAHALYLYRQLARCMDELPVTGCGTFTLCGVTLTVEDRAAEHGDGKTRQAVPADFADGCVLRTRRPGDWIRPFGMAGRMSLQDWLVNHKIDAPLRDRVPLLCRGSEVFLAAGIGAGAVPRTGSNDRRNMLVWSGRMPWLNGSLPDTGFSGKDTD